MKTVDEEMNVRITYSMTLEEARLINRITEGYVGLARFLTGEVKVKFPESEQTVSKLLQSLCEGTHVAIARAESARAVFDGRAVAVDLERMARLEAASKELVALKALVEKPRSNPDSRRSTE